MSKKRIKRAGLFTCLLLTGCILYLSTQGAGHPLFARAYLSQPQRAFLQNSPLASPLALANPAGQGVGEANAEEAVADGAPATVEEFQQQLPIYSGSRANQTSLVLIGAVLVGLVIVGTLVITRRD